jgi:hypothetical protein
VGGKYKVRSYIPKKYGMRKNLTVRGCLGQLDVNGRIILKGI